MALRVLLHVPGGCRLRCVRAGCCPAVEARTTAVQCHGRPNRSESRGQPVQTQQRQGREPGPFLQALGGRAERPGGGCGAAGVRAGSERRRGGRPAEAGPAPSARGARRAAADAASPQPQEPTDSGSGRAAHRGSGPEPDRAGDPARQGHRLREALIDRADDAPADGSPPSGDASTREDAYAESDRLHYRLAALAARYVWGRLREGDCIGIGGGRAPTYVTEWLEQLAVEEWRQERIDVVSLAARLSEKEWGTGDVERKFDADDLLDRLGNSLAKDFKAWPVEFALASHPQREAPDITAARAPQLIGDLWEGPRVPDIAVFGVGVVSTGYPPLESQSTYTKGIETILEELKRRIGDAPTGPMLGDVCNHFWVLGERTEAGFRALDDIAQRLNNICISIPPSKLDKAADKILVAGGEQKYPAVRMLLSGPGNTVVRPTVLATDEKTALRLLADLEGAPGRQGQGSAR